MNKNGRIKEIHDLLSSATQSTAIQTHAKQCKPIILLSLIFGLSFTALTAITFAMCKYSGNNIKKANQCSATLQHDIVHTPKLKMQSNKRTIM